MTKAMACFDGVRNEATLSLSLSILSVIPGNVREFHFRDITWVAFSVLTVRFHCNNFPLGAVYELNS